MRCARLPGARLERLSGSDRNRAVPPWACGVPGWHRWEVGRGACWAVRAGTATCGAYLPWEVGGLRKCTAAHSDGGDFSVKISSNDLVKLGKCLFFSSGGNSLNLVKVGITSPLLTLRCFFTIS